MLLKKIPLNEEIARMQVLAGSTSHSTMLEEGFMSKLSAILGIGAMSLTSVLAQTGNLEKLQYSADKKSALEQAMADSNVVKKLQDLGVNDNNIQRAIDYSKGKEVTGYTEKTISSDRKLKELMKAGWHLTAAQSDTIIDTLAVEHPHLEVDTISVPMNEEAMFASGKFVTSATDVNNIKALLDSINNSGSILLNVTIMSSTDKQGISSNLQQTLSSIGYSPDNAGLSKARNDGAKNTLLSLGIDASMIMQDIKFEQGGPTIDQSARYVIVLFDVVKFEMYATPGQEKTINTKINTTFTLFKPLFKFGTIDIGKYKTTLCKTNIGHYNKKTTSQKCAFTKESKVTNKIAKAAEKSTQKILKIR